MARRNLKCCAYCGVNLEAGLDVFFLSDSPYCSEGHRAISIRLRRAKVHSGEPFVRAVENAQKGAMARTTSHSANLSVAAGGGMNS
jgi:hypothetical protein